MPNNYSAISEKRNYLRDPEIYFSKSLYAGLLKIYQSTPTYGIPKEKSFIEKTFDLLNNLNPDTRSLQYFGSWSEYPVGKNPTIDEYRPHK